MEVRNLSCMEVKSEPLFQVGETLKCLIHVERRDRRSSISPGDIVKVTQEFAFMYQGKQCQDITVQRGCEAPIAMLSEPGRFERVAPVRKNLTPTS